MLFQVAGLGGVVYQKIARTVSGKSSGKKVKRVGIVLLAGLLSLNALSYSLVGANHAATPVIPINDLGTRTYQGFQGGLYPGGSNTMPAGHAQVGQQRADQIQPLDSAGNPSASGKYAMLSIGISNASNEFCDNGGTKRCNAGTFMDQAAKDTAVNKDQLVIVNGAQGGKGAEDWANPANKSWINLNGRLNDRNVTKSQVQIVWLKVAKQLDAPDLPDSNAGAYQLQTHLGNIVRNLDAQFPNLQQVFVSSRSYGGYGGDGHAGEPTSYEGGFATKWLIQAQIDQMNNGGQIINNRSGDLNYANGTAPWLAWGPYLWADGLNPRSDGLIWEQSDFNADNIHPSPAGVAKAGGLLMDFFKNNSLTQSWFVGTVSTPDPDPNPDPDPTPTDNPYPCAEPHPTIGSRDDSGDCVKHLQWYLNKKFGYSVAEGGAYNLETYQAVKSFQATHGLNADGKVNAATWDALHDSVGI